MKEVSATLEELNILEEDRLILLEKSNKLKPILIVIPLLITLISLVFINLVPLKFMVSGVSIMASLISYFIKIGNPFKTLRKKVKRALLTAFMGEFYEEINYDYQPDSKNGRSIIKDANLISAGRYSEEDVIEGTFEDVDFYLSEVHLENKTDDSTYTVFKGILFKIKMEGKQFPNSRIQSKPGLIGRLFTGYRENKKFGFWYESLNENEFNHSLQEYFPFIQYLMKKQGDIRIHTQGNEMTIMMESDMKFLDKPRFKLSESFLKKDHYLEMNKQLNTLLFIVKTFAAKDNFEAFEEKLELKALEYVKHKMDA